MLTPIRFCTRVDAATPAIFKAFCDAQRIDGVFRFYRPHPDGDGETQQFFSVEFRDGRFRRGPLRTGRGARHLLREWIGICKRGEAEKLLRSGDTEIGGRIPVNPSGGLACFGEAVPAQALAQVCELTWQLRGEAGERQIEGAKAGITANQGLFGHGSSVIVKR